jgi:hypothetical protein
MKFWDSRNEFVGVTFDILEKIFDLVTFLRRSCGQRPDTIYERILGSEERKDEHIIVSVPYCGQREFSDAQIGS